MTVRTRFAPSPTGKQHIGGLRTALFAWLFARKHQGQFILRIEDTDSSRKVPESVTYLLQEMKWLGLDIDEGPSPEELKEIEEWADNAGLPSLCGDYGPYVQSLRQKRYEDAAEWLVEKGFAYRCDYQGNLGDLDFSIAGPSRGKDVDPQKPHVIRFLMPDSVNLTVHDAVKGPITWDEPTLRDPVLLKTDRTPTYHLACVIDDHHMEISHVIRSDEWLGTTPLHLLLYKAFEWAPPVFVHLPPIVGEDRKKLSKRHGSTRSSLFRDEGILPEALVNYMAFIGWSPGGGGVEGDDEVLPIEKLISLFSLEGISKSPGLFDTKKLEWMNGVYIRNLPSEEFIHRVAPFLEAAGLVNEITPGSFQQIAPHVQERVKTLQEVSSWVQFLYSDIPFERDTSKMFKKGITEENASSVINLLIEKLETIEVFTKDSISAAADSVVEQSGHKKGAVFILFRIAVLGSMGTPPLFESVEALGKKITIERLSGAAHRV